MMLKRLACLVALPLSAQGMPKPGDLALSPQRLFFQGRTRVQEVFLTNTGRSEATYRVGFLRLAMQEDGHIREVPELSRSAEPLLRFNPRQVTLAPGERQVVRVMLRKPEVLDEGEYRIHLLFQAVPPANALQPPPATDSDTGVHIQLIPIPGISIPVLVRHGQSLPGFAIEAAELQPGRLLFTTRMTGNVSLYGRLRIRFQPQDMRSPREIATEDGFVHYIDLPKQRIEIPVKNEGVAGNGMLLVDLLDESEKIIASATAHLGVASIPAKSKHTP